jgi:hypothetical protein
LRPTTGIDAAYRPIRSPRASVRWQANQQNRVPAGATAFAHRDDRWDRLLLSSWEDPAEDKGTSPGPATRGRLGDRPPPAASPSTVADGDAEEISAPTGPTTAAWRPSRRRTSRPTSSGSTPTSGRHRAPWAPPTEVTASGRTASGSAQQPGAGTTARTRWRWPPRIPTPEKWSDPVTPSRSAVPYSWEDTPWARRLWPQRGGRPQRVLIESWGCWIAMFIRARSSGRGLHGDAPRNHTCISRSARSCRHLLGFALRRRLVQRRMLSARRINRLLADRLLYLTHGSSSPGTACSP